MQQVLNKIESGDTIATPNTQDMDFMFPVKTSKEDTMAQIMIELKNQRERLDQHDTMYAELQRLQQELATTNTHIKSFEEANRRLHQQLSGLEQNTQLENNHEFLPLPMVTQPSKSTTSLASQWAHPMRNRQKKKSTTIN